MLKKSKNYSNNKYLIGFEGYKDYYFCCNCRSIIHGDVCKKCNINSSTALSYGLNSYKSNKRFGKHSLLKHTITNSITINQHFNDDDGTLERIELRIIFQNYIFNTEGKIPMKRNSFFEYDSLIFDLKQRQVYLVLKIGNNQSFRHIIPKKYNCSIPDYIDTIFKKHYKEIVSLIYKNYGYDTSFLKFDIRKIPHDKACYFALRYPYLLKLFWNNINSPYCGNINELLSMCYDAASVNSDVNKLFMADENQFNELLHKYCNKFDSSFELFDYAISHPESIPFVVNMGYYGFKIPHSVYAINKTADANMWRMDLYQHRNHSRGKFYRSFIHDIGELNFVDMIKSSNLFYGFHSFDMDKFHERFEQKKMGSISFYNLEELYEAVLN